MKKQKDSTAMKRSRKASYIAAVMIILVAVIAIFINGGFGKKAGIDGKYICEVESGDNESTKFTLNFDSSNMTYTETLAVSDTEVTLSKGTYVTEDETITTTSEDDGKVQNFLVDDTYIIAKDYLYDGEITDGDTFEASCSYTNSNDATDTITFRSDGTYTEDSAGETTEGTYERKGDFITRTDDSGSGMIDFLVYNNQITNSYYKAE